MTWLLTLCLPFLARTDQTGSVSSHLSVWFQATASLWLRAESFHTACPSHTQAQIVSALWLHQLSAHRCIKSDLLFCLRVSLKGEHGNNKGATSPLWMESDPFFTSSTRFILKLFLFYSVVVDYLLMVLFIVSENNNFVCSFIRKHHQSSFVFFLLVDGRFVGIVGLRS